MRFKEDKFEIFVAEGSEHAKYGSGKFCLDSLTKTFTMYWTCFSRLNCDKKRKKIVCQYKAVNKICRHEA